MSRARLTCGIQCKFSRARPAHKGRWGCEQLRGDWLTQVEIVQSAVTAAATDSDATAAMLVEIKVEVAKDPQVRGDALRSFAATSRPKMQSWSYEGVSVFRRVCRDFR